MTFDCSKVASKLCSVSHDRLLEGASLLEYLPALIENLPFQGKEAFVRKIAAQFLVVCVGHLFCLYCTEF